MSATTYTYDDVDKFPPMRQLAPEDRAILKRAAIVLDLPRKIVGAVGGYWWIDADASKGRIGKSWEAWNPLRNAIQAYDLMCSQCIDVHFNDSGVWVNKHKVFMPFPPVCTDYERQAIVGRAITMAVALQCKENVNDKPEPIEQPAAAGPADNGQAGQPDAKPEAKQHHNDFYGNDADDAWGGYCG